MSEIQIAGNKYIMARRNVMLIIVFTAINLVLMMLNSDMYFLFSATMPQVFYVFGSMFYETSKAVIFLLIGIVLALAVLGVYLLGFIFAKKNYNWMTFIMIFFAIDIAFLLFLVFLNFLADGILGITSSLLDIGFHIYIIVTLIQGVRASSKLKKANVTINEVFAPDFLRVPVQPITQNEQIQGSNESVETVETVESADVVEHKENETEE